ncbi:MAG: TRAM domain-containing protein [Chlorobia bacterium]|nr:TRAM domain-containing protein [Fimbriimonadaceae bacterium]
MIGREIVRLIVILLFATLGAIPLGISAPTIMNQIFLWVVPIVRGKVPEPNEGYSGAGSFASVFPLIVLGGIAGAWVGSKVFDWLERTIERWDKMAGGDKVTLFIGLFVGVVISLPFLVLFQAIGVSIAILPVLIVALTLGFVTVSIYALQSMDEILPWSRNRGKTRRTGIKILDTNVIIDGRIYDVARAGFLEGQIYVPGFVLDELQYIADDHNGLRRQRGRRGLEVLKHMQAEFPMEVRVYDKYAADPNEPVDSRLVRLAKALGGDIITNDFNLNRVAALQDVKVLNLNDLALALRPNVLPQEALTLAIIREGNQPGQGIGYLEDGTMVVVENGRPAIGETAEVMVTQVIQTERGKLIFGEIRDEEGPEFQMRKPKKGGLF